MSVIHCPIEKMTEKFRNSNLLGRYINLSYTGWGEIIFTIQQKLLLKIVNYFPQCTDKPDFICAFKQQVFGLSKEVHKGFLAQRT